MVSIRYLQLPESAFSNLSFLEKYRDILKIYDDHLLVLILGIENQSDLHLLMPLRQLLYDALRYENQRSEIARRHKKAKDLTGLEYLSGFSDQDRLPPILSIVVYWGTEPWTAPLSLHELLDIREELMEYKDKINDYRISLLDVGRMENLQDYHGELKALLGFVRYQKDDEQLEQFVRQNQALFSKISMETVQAMAVLGNAGNLKNYIHPDSDKEESIMYADVNEALQKMMDKKWNEGHISGVHNKAYRAARNMYNRGFLIQDTASLLEESPETVRKWYQEWDGEKTGE